MDGSNCLHVLYPFELNSNVSPESVPPIIMYSVGNIGNPDSNIACSSASVEPSKDMSARSAQCKLPLASGCSSRDRSNEGTSDVTNTSCNQINCFVLICHQSEIEFVCWERRKHWSYGFHGRGTASTATQKGRVRSHI
jgi:hypothetical protein